MPANPPTAPGQKSAAELRIDFDRNSYDMTYHGRRIALTAIKALESSERREAELRAENEDNIKKLHAARHDLRSAHQNIDALNATIASQAARIAGLEADARRYRKLRALCDYEGPYGGYPNPGTAVVYIIRMVDGRRSPQSCTGDELDAALAATTETQS